MDEFRIWSTPRTSVEIGTYYNLNLTGSEPNLSVYYDFNSDISGANNSVLNIAQTGAANNGQSSATNFPAYAPSCAIIIGLEENFDAQNIVIFPNPGADELIIELDNFTELASIVFYDTNGKIVKRVQPSSNSVQVGTNELSIGVYSVIFESTDGFRSSRRWIKF